MIDLSLAPPWYTVPIHAIPEASTLSLTKEQLDRLKIYYQSLRGQQQVLERLDTKSNLVDGPTLQVLIDELQRIERDYPRLLPPFSPQDHFSHRGHANKPLYDISGILAYMAGALARLEALLTGPESLPVTQVREFAFVSDRELRKVLERDYDEIQRCYIAKCWKSVIILSGSAMEAILLDCVQQDSARARAATKAPNKSDLTKWDLAELIDVCVQVGYVSSGVEKLSHSVREYRNLVHPGNEVRNKLTFGAEEAKIALEVLHIIHRELS